MPCDRTVEAGIAALLTSVFVRDQALQSRWANIARTACDVPQGEHTACGNNKAACIAAICDIVNHGPGTLHWSACHSGKRSVMTRHRADRHEMDGTLTNCGLGHTASVSLALTPRPFLAAASVLRMSTCEGIVGADILTMTCMILKYVK
jgi:hypothetical protein